MTVKPRVVGEQPLSLRSRILLLPITCPDLLVSSIIPRPWSPSDWMQKVTEKQLTFVIFHNVGGLLKGATDKEGNLKDAGLMVGIKLDLEAEVHLTARVRGDVVIGLY